MSTPCDSVTPCTLMQSTLSLSTLQHCTCPTSSDHHFPLRPTSCREYAVLAFLCLAHFTNKMLFIFFHFDANDEVSLKKYSIVCMHQTSGLVYGF